MSWADSFLSKLEKLSESQQSIQTLSHWVSFHKKHSKEAATIWAAEAMKADSERVLLYVYLVNDILQNSKRKGQAQFEAAFGAELARVLPAAHAAAPEHIQKKMARLLQIWEERETLLPEGLKKLQAALGVPSSQTPPASAAASAVAPLASAAPAIKAAATRSPKKSPANAKLEVNVPNNPSEFESSAYTPRSGGKGHTGVPLAQLLESLEQGGLIDELAAEREADLHLEALEVDAADLQAADVKLSEAAKAAALLASHRAQLEEHLKERRELIVLLSDACEKQHRHCEQLSTSLEECAGIERHLGDVRSRLKRSRSDLEEAGIKEGIEEGIEEGIKAESSSGGEPME